MISLAEDHSFECLDLALPEVTCQFIAASSAAVMANTGQGIHSLCIMMEEMVLSKLEETMSPTHCGEGMSLAPPAQEGTQVPGVQKSLCRLRREDRSTQQEHLRSLFSPGHRKDGVRKMSQVMAGAGHEPPCLLTSSLKFEAPTKHSEDLASEIKKTIADTQV